jgi:hypothetical protein
MCTFCKVDNSLFSNCYFCDSLFLKIFCATSVWLLLRINSVWLGLAHSAAMEMFGGTIASFDERNVTWWNTEHVRPFKIVEKCIYVHLLCNFRRISYSLVGKDGNVEYTPSPGIFHPARNNSRRCFPACTVRMQVFNIAELNISVIKK